MKPASPFLGRGGRTTSLSSKLETHTELHVVNLAISPDPSRKVNNLKVINNNDDNDENDVLISYL